MTQVELGHRLAADAPTVSRIESGKKDLRTSELFEVARALGCVPADLARLPSADA